MIPAGFDPAADPLQLLSIYWPTVDFSREQLEVIDSVVHNDETVVVAGNQLGKDFCAGFIALWFFLCHGPPFGHYDPTGKIKSDCRIITTSVAEKHLIVLWSEINWFLQNARYPLDLQHGGPLLVMHREIYRYHGTQRCPKSYMIGRVSERGEGMAGHHAESTLAVIDEASGVDDEVYHQMAVWAGGGNFPNGHRKRMLIFGNPNPTSNFFRRFCDKGDII